MTNQDILETIGFSKDELTVMIAMLKLHDFSIASALSACVDSGVFDCDESADLVSLAIIIEKVKYTSENRPDVWDSEELEMGQWIKDALED